MAEDTPDRAALLAEAYKRGLLPDEQRGAYEEAIKRGLVAVVPGPGYVPEKAGQQFASGLRDPFEGAAGLLQQIPGVRKGGPGELGQDPAAREQMLRETQGEPGMARTLGQVASPANFIPGMVAGRGTTTLGRVGRAVMEGGVGGALAPAPEESFWATKAAQTGGGMAGGLALHGMVSGAAKGLEALGGYLAREFPENVQHQAVQVILKRIAQDQKAGGPSAEDMMDLVTAANTRGKPLTPADVGEENVLGLLGNVVRQPGEARTVSRKFLSDRDKTAGDRIKADIADTLHGGQTSYQTAEALYRARSAAGNPAYEAMRNLQNINSERLQQFLNDPVLKQGMAHGYEIERLESLAANREFNPTQMGIDLDAEGNVKFISTPNMRVLDMGKQGLDAMIAAERNEITGRLSSRGVGLEKVREAYVAELDRLDTQGIYRAARESWSGPSKSLDALRMGRAVFDQGSPEEKAAAVAKLTAGDREFYRVGVADKLLEKLMRAGAGADEAKAIIGSPWMKGQLQSAFRTPEEFERFTQAITDEARMFETKFKATGGSATAERLAEDTSAENKVAAQAATFGKAMLGTAGHPLGFIGAAKEGWKLYRELGVVQPNPELNSKIAEILLTTDFKSRPELVKMLKGVAGGPAPINRMRKTSEAMTGQNSATRFLTGAPETAAGGVIGGQF